MSGNKEHSSKKTNENESPSKGGSKDSENQRDASRKPMDDDQPKMDKHADSKRDDKSHEKTSRA